MGTHRTQRTHTTSVDWSLTGGGAASSTTVAALGLTAAAAAGTALDIAPFWGAAGAVAGAATSVAVGAHSEATPGGHVFNLARWAGAGSWLTWCLVHTPWDVNTLLTLGVGAAVSGGLSRVFAARSRGEAAATTGGTALVLGSQARLEREWEERLGRITRRRPFAVEDVRHWATGAGYSLTVTPPGGMTRKVLGPYADALSGDARLPEGCGVEIDRGPHRGSVVLHVATTDRMRESIDYPGDFGPRSILDPVVLGEHRDSSPAQVSWREHSALFAGQKGSGKTTLLNVSTAGVGRCTDALIWHIDLTGGGLSRAWLEPWLRGESERPALDWAACTPDDALAMVQAALEISRGRKESAFDKKLAADSSLLPIGEDLPEIVLIADEGKTLLNPTNTKGTLAKVRKGLEELQDIARDSAVTPVLSSLRATADTLAPAIKKQAVCRGAMAGSDDEEIAYLLGWKNLSSDDLAGPGTGFLTDGGPIRPFRCFQLTPRRIGELALTIAARRPELDAASVRAAGAAYARRYERMAATFGDGAPAAAEATEHDRQERGVPAGAGSGRGHLRSVPMSAQDWLREDDDEEGELEEVGGGAAVIAAPEQWSLPDRTGPAEDGEPDVLGRALAVLEEAGDDRIHSEDLAAALGYASSWALAADLNGYGVSTLPNKFNRGGRTARGYAREDLAAAARRQSAPPA
ncbi:S-DNA-T family DNA segregation ATPase FtsK/SpoIIIE [Streptomonospora salina]|uniref:S-DNA-T family DNA segregation ATPase FtsK/SpoIIIE n=1 Tax=Streptomonospora salina TaxID=104205 RepID=A0A841EGD0_9ACTN|nr:hypothetical protein [Streptomonospora salina]MBB6001354.1 S-DNA-T family DNA segregation ATPase FtsK/SpoIIIE [Streptomonospora salina]